MKKVSFLNFIIVTLYQGRATIYFKGPKRTRVIILPGGQFSTKQKQLFLLILAFKKIFS